MDGTIRRIGSIDPSMAPVETIDLGERWLIPGLWDNHVHFSQWAQTARRLDLSAAASAAETAALVAEHLPGLPAGESLIGFGFRDGLWPDAPGRAVLDAASGSVPVVLVSGDLHSCWLNSAALARHGFADHPTGLLREDDSFLVVRAIDTVEDEVMDAWADEAARAASSAQASITSSSTVSMARTTRKLSSSRSSPVGWSANPCRARAAEFSQQLCRSPLTLSLIH